MGGVSDCNSNFRRVSTLLSEVAVVGGEMKERVSSVP